MSARRKTPTSDENKKTAIFDSGKHGKPPPPPQYGEGDETVVDGPLGGPTHDQPGPSKAAPTVLAKPAAGKPAAKNAAPTVLAKPVQQSAARRDPDPPIVAISKKEVSSPIQAISMKTPGQGMAAQPENPPTPIIARPKLRAVSEVTPAKQHQNLGNLASPYDPKEARARAMREYVIYGCLAVILASGIALVVWFVAR